ncbi:hypothetical protein J8273_7916 [Carpediemonas membranifera]|uniref:PH domain-containing protein n=1 Tax=Carpediemonas membranifera TaxID=201153 RepID=A0A8J6E7C6_9EUKA|nr:hypothetical protein J8273_7916 [Carpediemonas membranifera]|eukprot:KAG9390565.1 hypothetical protein J8273_7916 [Carpediemonas membranifera]
MSTRGSRAAQRHQSLLRHSVRSSNATFTSRSTLVSAMEEEEDKSLVKFANFSLIDAPVDLSPDIQAHALVRTNLANEIEDKLFSVPGLGEMHVLAAEMATIESIGNAPRLDTDPDEKASDAWFVSPSETAFALDTPYALTVARDWSGAYALFFIDPKAKASAAIHAAVPLLTRFSVVSDEDLETKEMHRLELSIDDARFTVTMKAPARAVMCKALAVALHYMYSEGTVSAKLLTRMTSVDFAQSRLDDNYELTVAQPAPLPPSALEDEVSRIKNLPVDQVLRRKALLRVRRIVRNNEARNLLTTSLAAELEAIAGVHDIGGHVAVASNIVTAVEQLIILPWKHGDAFRGTIASALSRDDPDAPGILERLQTKAASLQPNARSGAEALMAKLAQLKAELRALDSLCSLYPSGPSGRPSLAPMSFPPEFHVDELVAAQKGTVRTPWEPGLYVAALVLDEADETVLIDSERNLPAVRVTGAEGPMAMGDLTPEDQAWLRASAGRDASIAAMADRTGDDGDMRGKLLASLTQLTKDLGKDLGMAYDRVVTMCNPHGRGRGQQAEDASTQPEHSSPDATVRVIIFTVVENSGVKPEDKKTKRRLAKDGLGYKVSRGTWAGCTETELALYHTYMGVSKNANLDALPAGFDGIRFIRAAEDYWRLRQPGVDLPPGVHVARVNLLSDLDGDYVLVDTTSRQLPMYPLAGCIGPEFTPMAADMWGWVQAISIHRQREGPDTALPVDATMEPVRMRAVEKLREAFMVAVQDMIADWGDEGALYDANPVTVDEGQQVQVIPFVHVWTTNTLPAAVRANHVWRPLAAVELDYATRHQTLRLSQYRADIARAEDALRQATVLARNTGDGSAVRLAREALAARQMVWTPMQWLGQLHAWAALGMPSVLDAVRRSVVDVNEPAPVVLAEANERHLAAVGGVSNAFLFDVITCRVASDDGQMALKLFFAETVAPLMALYQTYPGSKPTDRSLSVPARGAPNSAEAWQLVESVVRSLLGVGEESEPLPSVRPAEQVAMEEPPVEALDVEFTLKELLAKDAFVVTTYDDMRCVVEEAVETALVQTVDTRIFLEVEATLEDVIDVVSATADLVEDAVWLAVDQQTRASIEQEKAMLDNRMSMLFTQALPDLTDLPDDGDESLPPAPSALQYADLLTPFTPTVRRLADRLAQLVSISDSVLDVVDTGIELGKVTEMVTDMGRMATEKHKTAVRKAERARRAQAYQEGVSSGTIAPATPNARTPKQEKPARPATTSVSIADLLPSQPLSRPTSATPSRTKPSGPPTRRRTKLQGSAQTEQFIKGLKTLNSVYHTSVK